MNTRSFWLALTIAFCTVFGVGQALAQTTPPAASGPPSASSLPVIGESASSGYILGRDDVIEIGLLGRNDFGGRARVQVDGTIQLPLVGKITASERTTAELSDAIRKSLQSGGFFADPIVTVEVVSFASRYVTVLGAVNQPGLIPMNRPYRMSEILAKVGGVRSDGADYLIVRSEKGEEKRLPITELATGDLTADPYAVAGDKIFAPTADLFYIYGAINAPGPYPLLTDMNARMALVRGGGLTQSGSDKKIDATRKGKKVRLTLDSKVEPGDVLLIGERLF